MTAYDALVAELDTRNALIAALRAENEALRARVAVLESARRSLRDMREVSDYRPSDSDERLRARLDNLDHQIGNMIFNLDQQVKS